MSILADEDALVTDVRDLINETTANFWTDAFIKRQLEKAHQILSTRLRMIHNLWTATLVTGTPGDGEAKIIDDREIRFPANCMAIDDGGIYYNDDRCSPTTIGRLKSIDEDWLDRTGTPTEYYLRGDMIGFNRKISASDTVRIYGTGLPTELSDETDPAPFDGDYRTVGYRELLVDYAVGMCWKKKRDLKTYAFYLAPKVGVFWQKLEEMREDLFVSEEEFELMSESNISHFYRRTRFPNWNE